MSWRFYEPEAADIALEMLARRGFAVCFCPECVAGLREALERRAARTRVEAEAAKLRAAMTWGAWFRSLLPW